MSATLNDPRIGNGMRAQLALRRKRLDAGAKQIGWKVGFGAPAAMEKLKLTAPLVGFLLALVLVAIGQKSAGNLWQKLLPLMQIKLLLLKITRELKIGGLFCARLNHIFLARQKQKQRLYKIGGLQLLQPLPAQICQPASLLFLEKGMSHTKLSAQHISTLMITKKFLNFKK